MAILSTLIFPEQNEICTFLSKDARTRDIDEKTRETVSKCLANQSIDSFFLSSKISFLRPNFNETTLQFRQIKSALKTCGKGKCAQERLSPKFSALAHAEKGSLHEFFEIFNQMIPGEDKNKVQTLAPVLFAKKGNLSGVNSLAITLPLRDANKIRGECAYEFAKNEFYQEALECFQAIQNDWSEYDNSEYFTSLKSDTASKLVELLLIKKKYQEANQYVRYLELKGYTSHNCQLKETVEKGLGTYSESSSISTKRYWSRKKGEKLTIEELTVLKITRYIEKRARKMINYENHPSRKEWLPSLEKLRKWEDETAQQLHTFKTQYCNEFFTATVQEKIELLNKTLGNLNELDLLITDKKKKLDDVFAFLQKSKSLSSIEMSVKKALKIS